MLWFGIRGWGLYPRPPAYGFPDLWWHLHFVQLSREQGVARQALVDVGSLSQNRRANTPAGGGGAGLRQQTFTPPVLEAGGPRPGVAGPVPLRPLLSAQMAVSSSGSASMHVCVLISSDKDTSSMGLGPPQGPHFASLISFKCCLQTRYYCGVLRFRAPTRGFAVTAGPTVFLPVRLTLRSSQRTCGMRVTHPLHLAHR